MAKKVPKKTVKRVATGRRPVRNTSTVSLKQPAWKKWMVRPLTISQAAIITMGWEPMPGLKAFISDRPLKLKDLRGREHEIEEACRTGRLPVIGNGLPRRVSLQDSLTFAQSKGWSLPRRTQEVLDRIRSRISPAAENINDLKPPLHEEPPAQGLLKLPDAVRPPNSSIDGTTRDSPQKPTNRLADSLLRIIGALSVEIEDLAKKCKSNRLLDGDALNVSGLSRAVSALISKERGSNTELPGFTERTIHSHLSSARKKFFEK